MANKWGKNRSSDRFFGGSKIAMDGDCNHEIKRRLLLGRRATTNLDSVIKSRDIILPAQVHVVKAMVLPVVMCGCELDHRKAWAPATWCFHTVVLEKTLGSLLDCKDIKPVNAKGKSTLTVHWKDWCWKWSSSTLATWCEESALWRWPWCRQRLKAKGEEGNRGWDGWRASLPQWTRIWANCGK